MIKSIANGATRQFILEGKSKFSGLDVVLAQDRLDQINAARSLVELGNLNSVGLHKLKGSLRRFWSVDVNGPWRIIFRYKDGHAYDVEILDTH
jgi:proteic killer suppression protein